MYFTREFHVFVINIHNLISRVFVIVVDKVASKMCCFSSIDLVIFN